MADLKLGWVSVVIPTYKRPEKVRQAVEHVLQQSYANIDIIVIDDNGQGSDYQLQTQAVLSDLVAKSQVCYIAHSKNMGACAARNTGIEKANGEYIAFLDDDDQWLASKIERQVKALSDKNADVCYCDMFQTLNGREKVLGHRLLPNPYETLLNRGFGLCTSALMVRTNAVRKIRGFDDDLPSLQDYDLLIRLAKDYLFCEIPEPLMYYHLSNDGITRNSQVKMDGHAKVIQKYKEEYESLGLSDGLSRHYESLADFSLMSANRCEALIHYKKALVLSPNNNRIKLKLCVGSVFGALPLKCFLEARRWITSRTLDLVRH